MKFKNIFRKSAPSDTSTIDDAKFTDITDQQQAEINDVSHQAEESELQKRMVAFLTSKGYDVTPSGTPKNGVITNTVKTVTETGENVFYISRGVARKVKSNINSKLDEFKKAGL
jgi:hypothetical protein